MTTRLQLVVPCYNEAQRLKPDVWISALEAYDWLDLIFVDDGSTDDTGALLARIRAAHPDRVRHLSHHPNAGKAEAVRQGLRATIDAGAELTGFWDADLATPLDEIPRLLQALIEQPDLAMVLGSRIKMLGTDIRRNPWRHWAGRVAATLASEMFDLLVYDTQCGAKLMRVDPTLAACLHQPFLTRWAFDVELILRWWRLHPELSAEQLHTAVIEVPLRQWHEIDGTKVRLSDALRTPYDLLRIQAQLRPQGRLVRQMRLALADRAPHTALCEARA